MLLGCMFSYIFIISKYNDIFFIIHYWIIYIKNKLLWMEENVV